MVMKRKRYEVRGMMEWHPVFRAGRTRLRVSFTGGHLCGGAATPACFETADEVVQKVIESSAAFRSGSIVCRAVGDVPRRQGAPEAPKAEPPKEVAAEAPEAKAPTAHRSGGMPLTVMEFDSHQKAADFLQDRKGLTVDRVLTVGQCKAEALLLGIDLRIKEGAAP